MKHKHAFPVRTCVSSCVMLGSEANPHAQYKDFPSLRAFLYHWGPCQGRQRDSLYVLAFLAIKADSEKTSYNIFVVFKIFGGN